MAKQDKPKEYWYRFHMGECPVCGRNCSYKERVYGPKPEDPKERYVYIPLSECFDWCTE